jgi:hypothetical protein
MKGINYLRPPPPARFPIFSAGAITPTLVPLIISCAFFKRSEVVARLVESLKLSSHRILGIILVGGDLDDVLLTLHARPLGFF